jgi:hypothetical protein
VAARLCIPYPDGGGPGAPLPRRAAGQARRLSWRKLALGSLICVALLAMLAERVQRAPADASLGVPQTLMQTPDSGWTPVVPPVPLVTAASPTLKGLESRREMRRHAAGGEREDTLSWGSFAGGGRFALIVATRGGEAGKSRSFSLDVIRQAARGGIAVLRMSQPEPVASKLGDLAGATVTLAEAGERTCEAFRWRAQEVDFALAGWLCSDGARSAQRHELACLVDSLVLTAPAADAALRVLFAQADRRRLLECEPGSRALGDRISAR